MFPDKLDNAKVLFFTSRGDYGTRYLTNGEEWFHACYLAICQYEDSPEYYLFECNEDFEVESDYDCESAEACMALAENLSSRKIEWHSKVIEGQENKKNIYTIRLLNVEGLAEVYANHVGKQEYVSFIFEDVSWSAYFVVPDFNKTDTIVVDVLFDKKFREKTELRVGDRIKLGFLKRIGERMGDITDIVRGQPFNYLETRRNQHD